VWHSSRGLFAVAEAGRSAFGALLQMECKAQAHERREAGKKCEHSCEKCEQAGTHAHLQVAGSNVNSCKAQCAREHLPRNFTSFEQAGTHAHLQVAERGQAVESFNTVAGEEQHLGRWKGGVLSGGVLRGRPTES
jgi:hypothetical protein